MLRRAASGYGKKMPSRPMAYPKSPGSFLCAREIIICVDFKESETNFFQFIYQLFGLIKRAQCISKLREVDFWMQPSVARPQYALHHNVIFLRYTKSNFICLFHIQTIVLRFHLFSCWLLLFFAGCIVCAARFLFFSLSRRVYLDAFILCVGGALTLDEIEYNFHI